ncbi:hypothetical protein CERZMDRAFT_95585 [Cercospora zeae-maydis SCOH1-5]|uniref:Uncharacterized protein n=1 Tax=Cercospora zeae-maydis SCOH1-5 TaxID=717836 RepID=A0A6A6FLG7_9PEZI|nr:hypothetical protein CERZMDRAFT_95585 [Cercospora zeae-maydis SCOH1-5]
MAGDNQGATASPRKTSNESDRLGRLKRSLPKLITWFPRSKLGKRSKTDDAVIRKEHGKPEVFREAVSAGTHDCMAIGADCQAGPSTLPARMGSSTSGYHGDIDRSAMSASTGQSASIDWASRFGSSANSDRNSESWTTITTPEKTTAERFVPRPGIIPDTSSAEDERTSNGSSAEYMSSPYAPRVSDGTPAEAVRIHSEEVPPDQGLEQSVGKRGLIKAASTPAATQGSRRSHWRSALSSKQNKGKGKARDFIEDVDGRPSKKNGDKKFSKSASENPASQKTLPVINPGHDTWAEMPLLQKKKLSAKVNSDLSKFNWSAAEWRKQPAVTEPVGPAGERAWKSSFPDILSRKEKESRMALPPVVTSINGISTARVVPAGLPAAVPEIEDHENALETDGDASFLLGPLQCSIYADTRFQSISSDSSDSGSQSGYSIASESSSSNLIPRQKARDSTRLSRTGGRDTTHYSTGSIDLEALNSRHAKAADFEKFAKKKSSGSKKTSSGTIDDDDDDDDDDGEARSPKLEMWRTSSKADGAQFVICQSPEEIRSETVWW